MDKRDLIGGTAWLCLAGFFLIASLNLGIGSLRIPGPGFIPFCGSVCLALLAGAVIVSGARKKGRTPPARLWKDEPWGRVAAVAAALIAYGLLLTRLGYVLTTLGLMVFLLSLGKVRPWAAILGSLLAVLLSYGLFHYALQAPLPRGLLAF